MTEKRYKLFEHNECDYILDNPNESLDFIEMLGDALSSEEIVDRLNEQSETIQQLQRDNQGYKMNAKMLREDYPIVNITGVKYVQLEKVKETLQEAFNQNKRHASISSLAACIMIRNIAKDIGVEIE